MTPTQEPIIREQVSQKAQKPATVAAATGNVVTAPFMATTTGAKTIGNKVVFGVPAAILTVIGVSAQTRQFDRQTFLAAVKDRLKTQSEIMETRSDFDPLWSLDDRRTAWQNDIASIPGLTIPSSSGKASFGIALAYVASQESNVTFASRRGDGLVHLVGADESRLSISLDVRFRQFGQELLRAMFNEKLPCSSQGFFHYTAYEVQFANSICTDLKQTVADARREFAASGLKRAQLAQAQAAAEAHRQAEQPLRKPSDEVNSRIAELPIQHTQQTQQTDAVNDAKARFDRLNGEKETLTAALRGFEDLGPLPPVAGTKPSSRIGARRGWESGNPEYRRTVVERMNAESAKIEEQLPSLREELRKRQEQAISQAKQSLQRHNLPIQQVRQLASLVEKSGSSPDGVLKAYQAAKKLEADLQALSAAKERAGKVIASARTELGVATKTPDQEIGTAAKVTAQTMNDLSAKVQSMDLTDTPQINTLADRLQAESGRVHGLTTEKAVMGTATGRRVYDGCYAWAKRQGLIAGTQVRVFKDEETNKAAEMATNPGQSLCRCMAVSIAGDNSITDAAKVEIARQFETRDRMDNAQLKMVVGVAAAKCQMNMMNELQGK